MARKTGNNTTNGGGGSPKKKAAVKSSNSSGGKSRATKAPKRIRRKCSAPNCNNRVVQGGVCVTHGAKRKLCSHPGCTKAVKLAGACSTHGPARKKCDTEGCTRVAVQGGKCLSHGARRKICNYPCVGGKKPCERNAIMGGMCKKHYDHVQNAESMLEMSYCVPVRSESMANKKDDSSSSSGESDEEVVKSFPSPAWTGAAPEFAGSSSTTAMANTAPPMATNYHHPGYVQAPSYYAPETGYGPSYGMSSSSYRQPKKIATRPGHQRGLSIFDEMNTVNAIIGTSGTEHPTTAHYPPHHPPQYQQQVSSYHHSQAQAAAATAVRMPSMSNTSSKSTTTGFKRQNSLNTKTPATQVSFADGTRKPSNGEKPCTGDASCTCDACRSPTLAIFEQMIQASQRIDSGDIDTDKYSGLSAPKLSPRKTAKEENKAEEEKNSAGEVKVGPKSPSPKNVSFMEEEPTSSGSVVVRKVSNNNMEGQSSTTTQYADHQGQESRQDSPKRGEGPASHALVAMAIRDSEAESGSRTVSYDVDDSRQRRQYYSQHPPPPQPAVHYGHHPQHHPPPQHHYYQYPPHHGHAPPAYGHPPHHHYAPPAYHHQAPPHYAHSAPAAHYQPPQTPSLYDNKSSQGPQEGDSSSAAVVSSHSAHQDQQLLPKRREDIDHLFIPKEV